MDFKESVAGVLGQCERPCRDPILKLFGEGTTGEVHDGTAFHHTEKGEYRRTDAYGVAELACSGRMGEGVWDDYNDSSVPGTGESR